MFKLLIKEIKDVIGTAAKLCIICIITYAARSTDCHFASLSGQTVTGTTDGSSIKTLAERLGYKATDKLLIINIDDAGNLYSTNQAVFDGMEKGIVTTSTVMVPCSWFYQVVQYQKLHPEADFGVHLVHREPLLGPYRYEPVAGRNEVPGLYSQEGFFWTTPAQFQQHSNPMEAEIEGRAQIRKALAAGMDISHIDSHTGILSIGPEYFAVYVNLAREFDLPVRFAGGGKQSEQTNRKNEISYAKEMLDKNGILYTDYIISPGRSTVESAQDSWKRLLTELKPGVTEAFCHACISTDESRAALNDAKGVPLPNRIEDYNAVTNDPEIKKLITDQGIILIKWKAIRDLQRKSSSNDFGKGK